MHTAQSRP